MMSILPLIVLWTLTVFLYLRNKTIVAPSVLNSFTWAFVLTLYTFSDHNLYELSNDVIFYILIWVLMFTLGTTFPFLIKLGHEGEKVQKISEHLRKIYYLVTLIGTPGLLFIAYKQGTTLGQGSFLFNLRMANTGIVETEYNYGIFAYVITFAFVSYITELYILDKASKKRLFVLVFINLVFSLITMAKTSFFFLIFPTVIVFLLKRRLKIRTVLYAIASLIGIFAILTSLRSSEGSFGDTIALYTLGGLPALDILIHSPLYPGLQGAHVFKFFYTVQNALGIGAYDLEDISFGYSYVPMPTNVYTVMYPFAYDYGIVGVGIFSFIYGLISGAIYKRVLLGVVWAKLLYSFWAGVLLLQFFGEYIFTNLSYTLQLVLLFYLSTRTYTTSKWKK